VTNQTPRQFRASIRRTKDLLEEITGTPVLGFRAPSFSIVAGREWALDVLIEEGYRYDSSLFPVRRPAVDTATRRGCRTRTGSSGRLGGWRKFRRPPYAGAGFACRRPEAPTSVSSHTE